jgi:hypothetical protein
MPDLPGMPSTIRCVACGFENTTTSLYCQDCGLRLVAPPSAIAEETAASPARPVVRAHPSPRILSARRSNRVGSFLTITLRTLVVAALAALIIQILRPPGNLPPAPVPLSAAIVNNVRAALQASAERGGPFDAPWSGQGLNAYLAAVLQPGPGSLGTAFQRALLAPVGTGFSLIVGHNLAGLTLYSRVDYRIVARGSGIGVAPVGAALGRLPLPAWIVPAIDSMNGNLDQALASELDTLREAKGIRITPQKASIDFGPPRP